MEKRNWTKESRDWVNSGVTSRNYLMELYGWLFLRPKEDYLFFYNTVLFPCFLTAMTSTYYVWIDLTESLSGVTVSQTASDSNLDVDELFLLGPTYSCYERSLLNIIPL